MTLQEPVATAARTTTSGWRTAPQPSPQAAARTYASICRVGDTWWGIAGNNYPPNDMSSTDCVTWTDVPRSALSRPRNAGAAFNGQLFTTGGVGMAPPPSPPLPVPETWGRNPAIPGNWSRVPGATAWRGRREHMMAAFDDKLWVIGGASQSYQWYDEAWWAGTDISAGWQQDTSWTGPGRGDCGVAIYNNQLWIIAGRTNDPYVGMLGDAVCKAPGQAWQTQTIPGFAPRFDVQAQVVGGKLYVFGGQGGPAGGILDMWCYDGSTWTQLADTCPWGNDLFGYYSTVKDGEIYVMGGNNGSGPAGGNQTIYIYTPA